MILVIGGFGQGKLSYALSMSGLDSSAVTLDPTSPRPILADLEQWLKTKEQPMDALDSYLAAYPDGIILCAEVGSGVVPMDPSERAWRERVGRTCCALAERAEKVIRLYCGIPTVIKGE